MAKSGPKTYAQRQADGAIIPGARAPAPTDLEPEMVELWRDIVNRLPADWVTAETKPLLKEYCRHASYADRFAEDIVKVRATLDDLEGSSRRDKEALKAFETGTAHLHELHRAHGFQTDRLIILATKMRFTVQSKYVPQQAASRARMNAPNGPPPWHDWGDTTAN